MLHPGKDYDYQLTLGTILRFNLKLYARSQQYFQRFDRCAAWLQKYVEISAGFGSWGIPADALKWMVFRNPSKSLSRS